MKLYRIGELARLSDISPRTIDYYTKLGLVEPETRSDANYRLYSEETLTRLKRIHMMKKDKYTLDEIKTNLLLWHKVSRNEIVTDKLSSIQLHLQQLQKEVQEISPIIDKMKPSEMKKLNKLLSPQTVACLEALLLLLGKSPLS